MKKGKLFLVLLILLILSTMVFVGCRRGSSASGDEVVIRYSLWDPLQLPAYRTIIQNFQRENPGIRVELELTPWGEYWTKLATQAAGGNAPDLMNMQVNFIIDHVNNNNLEPIDDFIRSYNVDLSHYDQEFINAVKINGRSYGIPKDSDSYAIFYNKDLLRRAGYNEYPRDLSWEPENGGSFVEMLKRLTLDNQGRNAAHPNFDPRNIVQYGINLTQWPFVNADVWFAAMIFSNGGRVFDDQGLLVMDEPRAMETAKFLGKLIHEWYVMPPLNFLVASGSEGPFYSEAIALWVNGPWTTTDVMNSASFEWGVSMLPKGPTGRSYSRGNSLYDVIYARSPNKEAAWKLALYIATEGQHILGSTGTVIPAYRPAAHTYAEFYRGIGIDVQAFIDSNAGYIILPPFVNNWPRIDELSRAMFSETLAAGRTVADVEAGGNRLVREVNAFQRQ